MMTRRIATLVAVGLLVAACSAGPGSGGQLEGTTWVLRSYQQNAGLTILPENLYADADFDAFRVTGFGGCNQYDALYRSGGRTLFVSQPAVTLMACDQPAMDFEQAFISLLQASRYYDVGRDTLTIFDADRSTTLVFDAAPRNPLLGKWLVTAYETTEGTVVAPPKGIELDVVFGIANVGGFSGCNSFSGTYGTNGNVVRISRLAATQKACATEVMDQEAAFLAALQGAALIDSRGPTLNLTDMNGHLVVGLARPPTEETQPSPSPTPSGTATPTAPPTPTGTPIPTPTAAPTATRTTT